MGTMQLEDGREDPRAKDARYSDKISKEFLKRGHEFAPTQFIIDDDYIGEPPRVQVSFENINDNIDEKFLNVEISEKIGKFSKLQIVRGPSGEHLGLAKVQFYSPEIAERCVQYYHGKSLMGRKLVVELDVRFENIERKKDQALRPVVRTIKPPEPIESSQTTTPVPFPPTPVSLTPQLDVDRPINRPHAPGSLLERLAHLGLAKGGFPPTPQPLLQPIQNNNITPRTPTRQDNLLNRLDRKPMIEHRPPSKLSLEEDEDAWNPPIPPSPVEEKIHLTAEEIKEISIPFVIEEFLRDLEKNLRYTSRVRILRSSGYPCLDKYSSEYKAEQDRKELQQRRQEQENVNRERERKAMMLQARHKSLQAKFLGREGFVNSNLNAGQVVRRRTGANDSVHGRVRLNRSTAIIDEEKRNINNRHSPFYSSERQPSEFGSGSRSSSRCSSSSDSDESQSSDISVSSAPSESVSSISTASSGKRDASSKIRVESFEVPTKTAWHVEDKEETAANALLDLKRQPNQLDRLETSKAQLTTKKRKTKLSGQENRVEKRIKIDDDSNKHILSSQEKKTKILVKGTRSEDSIRQLEDDLTITDEDLEYLRKVHERFEDEQSSHERTRIPFGSNAVNEAHLIFRKGESSSESEKKTGNHPKWWNGCSRCSLVPHGTEGWKGAVEDVDYEKSQTALIKSHVIRTTNSARRNQRSDQRRLFTSNPDIDPAFFKHLTSSTLQLRAKNLRFSRSRIHMWGLFACEKIANGEAVIEYVGEKIRPSVADHRETEVYPRMSAHDGSSYFFRVDSDVIDAAFKGNKARFINHSCNPNCIAKVIKNENGSNSIVIYAKKAIEQDEEITYDYKFPREEGENKILCRCRAPNCKKYLN